MPEELITIGYLDSEDTTPGLFCSSNAPGSEVQFQNNWTEEVTIQFEGGPSQQRDPWNPSQPTFQVPAGTTLKKTIRNDATGFFFLEALQADGSLISRFRIEVVFASNSRSGFTIANGLSLVCQRLLPSTIIGQELTLEFFLSIATPIGPPSPGAQIELTLQGEKSTLSVPPVRTVSLGPAAPETISLTLLNASQLRHPAHPAFQLRHPPHPAENGGTKQIEIIIEPPQNGGLSGEISSPA